MATNTYKTFLMKKDGNAYAKLVDIKDFPDLGQAPATLDTTTLSDPQHTYIQDIKDTGGNLEFNCNYDPTSFDTLAALEGSELDLAVWFGGTEAEGVLTPTGSEGKFEFKGYLSVYVKGAGVGAVREMGVAISPTTEIVKASA